MNSTQALDIITTNVNRLIDENRELIEALRTALQHSGCKCGACEEGRKFSRMGD